MNLIERIEDLMLVWALIYTALVFSPIVCKRFILDLENPHCKSLQRQFQPKYMYFSFKYGYGLLMLIFTLRNFLALLFFIGLTNKFNLDVFLN